MVIVVERVVIVVYEIPSTGIVNEAVVVVVNAVTSDLARIGPDVANDILVIVIKPGINHGDHHAGAGLKIPGLRCVDIRVRRTGGLASIVQPIELGKSWIIWNCRLGAHDVVRLGVQNARIGTQCC